MPRLISAYSNASWSGRAGTPGTWQKRFILPGCSVRYLLGDSWTRGAIQELKSRDLRFAPQNPAAARDGLEKYISSPMRRAGRRNMGVRLLERRGPSYQAWASLNVKLPDDCRQLEQLYIHGCYWGCPSMTEQPAPRVILRRYIGSAICDVLVLVRGQEMVIRCRSYPQALKWARLECKSYRIPEPELEPLREVDGDEPPLFLRSHTAEENHD